MTNRCAYCGTWPGHDRCDNCGAPKAPPATPVLSGAPGRSVVYARPATSDYIIDGRCISERDLALILGMRGR